MLVVIAVLLALILLALINRDAANNTVLFGCGCAALLLTLGLGLGAGAGVFSWLTSGGVEGLVIWIAAGIVGLAVFLLAMRALDFVMRLAFPNYYARFDENRARDERRRREIESERSGWHPPQND